MSTLCQQNDGGYRQRAPGNAANAARAPRRRGPEGACSDTELLGHIEAVIEASPFSGEGYRKTGARLRHRGVRTAPRRVRRVMMENDLSAPQRPVQRDAHPHDGTIVTDKVDEVYGAGDARVAEVLVSVGDQVEKGAPLARLDNRTTLESAVLAAEANLAIKEAALMQTRAAVAASRDEVQAALDQAVSAAAEAASSLARTEELFHRKVTTEATLDTTRAASAAAVLAVTRAEVTLTRFSALALNDQPDVVVATRNREAAEAELARAKLDLERSVVFAPIAGMILDIHATPGQRRPLAGSWTWATPVR